MPKKAPSKKGIKKKTFDIKNMRKDLGIDNVSVKDKPLTYIPFSKPYKDAIGLPGVAKGYFTIFRGFSDTGKSTAVYEATLGCQLINNLPVIIDTENSWSWDHAREIGIKFEEVVDEETGEIIDYVGDFIYLTNDALLEMYGNFDYDDGKTKKTRRNVAVVEDVARAIEDLVDKQNAGEIPYEMCFMWDSIGSLDGFKGWKSKAKNNMWTAGSISTAFSGIVNHIIPSSRKENREYTNTFIGVQKIWLDSMQGAGVIKHKGGESLYYAARQIIHLGGITSHGTSTLNATSQGMTYSYGTKAKIKVVKNQIGGVTWDGVIASTPHGFVNPDNKDEYLKEHRDYLLQKLNITDGEIELVESAPSAEETKDMYVS